MKQPLVALAVACTAFVAPPPRGPRWAAPRATPADAEVPERRVVARVGARGLALRPGESIVAVDYGLRRCGVAVGAREASSRERSASLTDSLLFSPLPHPPLVRAKNETQASASRRGSSGKQRTTLNPLPV